MSSTRPVPPARRRNAAVPDDEPARAARPVSRRTAVARGAGAVAGLALGGAREATALPPASAGTPPAADPLRTMRMDHVALRVPNFEATIRWHREKLGFRELVRWKAPPYIDPELQFAYLGLNGAVVEVAGGGASRRVTRPYADIKDTFTEQGYLHVCLRVDDLDAAAAELRRRGVEIFAGPNTDPSLNRRFIHCKDNNGFDVEVVQYL